MNRFTLFNSLASLGVFMFASAEEDDTSKIVRTLCGIGLLIMATISYKERRQ